MLTLIVVGRNPGSWLQILSLVQLRCGVLSSCLPTWLPWFRTAALFLSYSWPGSLDSAFLCIVLAHTNQGLQDRPVPERLFSFTLALTSILSMQCTLWWYSLLLGGILLAPCFVFATGSLSPTLFLQTGLGRSSLQLRYRAIPAPLAFVLELPLSLLTVGFWINGPLAQQCLSALY